MPPMPSSQPFSMPPALSTTQEGLPAQDCPPIFTSALPSRIFFRPRRAPPRRFALLVPSTLSNVPLLPSRAFPFALSGRSAKPLQVVPVLVKQVKVATLLQPFPICKRLTEGEAAIFGKTEDVDRLVVDELRHTLFPKIVLDLPQVPCREVGADLRHFKLLLF